MNHSYDSSSKTKLNEFYEGLQVYKFWFSQNYKVVDFTHRSTSSIEGDQSWTKCKVLQVKYTFHVVSKIYNSMLINVMENQ